MLEYFWDCEHQKYPGFNPKMHHPTEHLARGAYSAPGQKDGNLSTPPMAHFHMHPKNISFRYFSLVYLVLKYT